MSIKLAFLGKCTLLADILDCSSELFLKELTFLCNLFSLFKEVLGSGLNGRGQNMSLLGTTFLFVRWAFVAGVHQSGNLSRDHFNKYISHMCDRIYAYVEAAFVFRKAFISSKEQSEII